MILMANKDFAQPARPDQALREPAVRPCLRQWRRGGLGTELFPHMAAAAAIDIAYRAPSAAMPEVPAGSIFDASGACSTSSV